MHIEEIVQKAGQALNAAYLVKAGEGVTVVVMVPNGAARSGGRVQQMALFPYPKGLVRIVVTRKPTFEKPNIYQNMRNLISPFLSSSKSLNTCYLLKSGEGDFAHLQEWHKRKARNGEEC